MNKQEMLAEIDLEVEISGYEAWEDFDQITRFLRTKCNASLIRKVDGPDARFCEFMIDEIVILLIFDDMIGNFLRAKSKESLDKIKRLGKEIETNLEFIK